MAKKTVIKKDSARTLPEMFKDLADLKRSNAAGELVNPKAITALRKDIARAKTAARLSEIKDQKENK